MFEVDAGHLQDMEQIARQAARKKLSPSAYGNLAEDVALQAVFEYWELLGRGDEIDNPAAVVTTIAKRRAIDAQRKWETRRHPSFGDPESEDDRVVVSPELVRRAMGDLPSTSVIIDWVGRLVLEGGGDETDATLARRVWLEGASPDEAAAEVGLAANTARNRLTAAKRRLEEMVERGEAPGW